MENKTVLVSITSVHSNNWINQMSEVKELGLKEIAIFPTTFDLETRKQFYKVIEDSSITKIPHVHLRHDFEKWEFEYLIERFHTEVFNIHPVGKSYVFPDYYCDYAEKIFVENLIIIPEDDELQKYAGLCLDFSHWEGNILLGSADYDLRMHEKLNNFSVGCCHVSAIDSVLHPDPAVPGRMQYDVHHMTHLQQLDYMKKYKKYLPKYISLELENSIAEQLKAKAYLEKILGIKS